MAAQSTLNFIDCSTRFFFVLNMGPDAWLTNKKFLMIIPSYDLVWSIDLICFSIKTSISYSYLSNIFFHLDKSFLLLDNHSVFFSNNTRENMFYDFLLCKFLFIFLMLWSIYYDIIVLYHCHSISIYQNILSIKPW